MRRSPKRHNLARLRLTIGCGQKEMAALAGCSASAIQAVELGKLSLSEELARRISAATGVDVGWLLDNDLSAIPKAHVGEDYTLEHYVLAQAFAQGSVGEGDDPDVTEARDELFSTFTRLWGVFVHLSKTNGELLPVSLWKLRRFLAGFEKEFGVWPKVAKAVAEGRATEVGYRLTKVEADTLTDPNWRAAANAAKAAKQTRKSDTLAKLKAAPSTAGLNRIDLVRRMQAAMEAETPIWSFVEPARAKESKGVSSRSKKSRRKIPTAFDPRG